MIYIVEIPLAWVITYYVISAITLVLLTGFIMLMKVVGVGLGKSFNLKDPSIKKTSFILSTLIVIFIFWYPFYIENHQYGLINSLSLNSEGIASNQWKLFGNGRFQFRYKEASSVYVDDSSFKVYSDESEKKGQWDNLDADPGNLWTERIAKVSLWTLRGPSRIDYNYKNSSDVTEPYKSVKTLMTFTCESSLFKSGDLTTKNRGAAVYNIYYDGEMGTGNIVYAGGNTVDKVDTISETLWPFVGQNLVTYACQNLLLRPKSELSAKVILVNPPQTSPLVNTVGASKPPANLTDQSSVSPAITSVNNSQTNTEQPVSLPIQDNSQNTIKYIVTDYTGTLNASELSSLTNKLKTFEQSTGHQLAVLVVASTIPESLDEFTFRTLNEAKLGRSGINDGMLILLSKSDRKIKISIGTGLEQVVSNEQASQIIQNDMIPQFSKGNVYEGLKAAVDKLIGLTGNQSSIAPSSAALVNDAKVDAQAQKAEAEKARQLQVDAQRQASEERVQQIREQQQLDRQTLDDKFKAQVLTNDARTCLGRHDFDCATIKLDEALGLDPSNRIAQGLRQAADNMQKK